MTRTARRATARIGLSLFALTFLAVGCGPNEKDLKIEDLTAENEQLKRELDDRDRQLAEAQARENEARSTIDELNRELARSRASVATTAKPSQPMQQPVAKADGWISTPSFDMISIPGEVLFQSGKADLSSGGRSTIAKLASDIRSRYGDRDIFVFGHTDNDPIRKSKWKDNWELGSARALTCIRELQQRGITGGSLIQANCGEFRPAESNASRNSKSKNRRVEFYAVPRGGVIPNSTASR